MAEDEPTVGWWVLNDDVFRDALERSAAGEDIELILLEIYANARIETVGGDE